MEHTGPTDTTDTKEHLLNVAERMIAERGYAATTLRSIVGEAGANLAAVHYHFGSKEELFRAVVARIAQPVITQELSRLAELEAQPEPPTVEAILTAMLTPCLEFVGQSGQACLAKAQFMGRCRVEPAPIQSIASHEFSSSEEAFIDALQRVLPHQTRAELTWKFDLVIAALVRVQTEWGKPKALIQGSTATDIEQSVAQLVKFLAAGMRA